MPYRIEIEGARLRVVTKLEVALERGQSLEQPRAGQLALGRHRRTDEPLATPLVGLRLDLQPRLVPRDVAEDVDVRAGEAPLPVHREREARDDGQTERSGDGGIDRDWHHRHHVRAPAVAGDEVAERVGLDHFLGHRKGALSPDNGNGVVLALVASGDVVQPGRRYGGDLLLWAVARVDRLNGEAIRVLEQARDVPDPL